MTSPREDGAYESQEDSTLEVVRARLHRDFDAAVGFTEVERAWNAARSRFDGSTIRTFVPILVERLAGEELRTAASAEEQRPTATDER